MFSFSYLVFFLLFVIYTEFLFMCNYYICLWTCLAEWGGKEICHISCSIPGSAECQYHTKTTFCKFQLLEFLLLYCTFREDVVGTVQMRHRKHNIDFLHIKIVKYSRPFLPPCNGIVASTKQYNPEKPNTANTITNTCPEMSRTYLVKCEHLKFWNLKGHGCDCFEW